jgi:hypothetical protein
VASKRFTPEFIEAFLAEQHWDLIDILASLTPQDIEPIVNRGAKCPICASGRDWPRNQDRDTAIVICRQVEHVAGGIGR